MKFIVIKNSLVPNKLLIFIIILLFQIYTNNMNSICIQVSYKK